MSGCGLTKAEETAIQFYKAVEVEGDGDKANQMMWKREWDWNEFADQGPNPPIQIAPAPAEEQTETRQCYMIHRPSDDRGYLIWLRKVGEEWKVVKRDSHRDFIGGIQQAYPGQTFDWKEVEQP